MEPPFCAARLKKPYKHSFRVVRSHRAAAKNSFINVHSDWLCGSIPSSAVSLLWLQRHPDRMKDFAPSKHLQKLIITSVLSFKKELTGPRAEAQVLQVKGCFITLHYQGTGSCFQENAFHAVVLLKGVSTCLWQEFQAGTQALLFTDMGFRSHILT